MRGERGKGKRGKGKRDHNTVIANIPNLLCIVWYMCFHRRVLNSLYLLTVCVDEFIPHALCAAEGV